MIHLDGSHGEGGGALVRIALALSTLTGKPFSIKNIRSNRPTPGLKNQHLHCITALQKLCNAKVVGARQGATGIEFHPGNIEGKTISIDIKTAGSTALLLQSLLLPSLYSHKKVRLKVKGGTDTKWATPIDFFREVFLPHLRRFAKIECKTQHRGFYPKGKGEVDIKIRPNLHTVSKKYDLVHQGNLLYIKGISHASSALAKSRVAERQESTARILLSKYNTPIQIRTEYNETASPGSGITLWAIFSEEDEVNYLNPVIVGADCLGEKTKRAEEVGQQAAQSLTAEIEAGSCVDRHTADQILPYLALVGGTIKTSEITDHIKSNIHIIEQFLNVTFNIQENIISCSANNP